MKVEELIIDGFKSYATRTVISGWDSSFNCITGLNGSGKSNILDAICFVLGITALSSVRAQNLQDLIYKRGQAGVTKASVTIVFDNSEKDKSPIGFEDQRQISVTRQVVLGGTNKYLINGHRAQQQSVQQLFQSVQLNINNPNFLIMQGQITKVLNMKPADILLLIEEAAGTRMFEERREKALKTMGKKEKKVEEILILLNEEIEPKLENLRNERRAFLDYQQTLSSLERTEKLVVAHDYVWNSEKLQSQTTELNDAKDSLDRITKGIAKTHSEIRMLDDETKAIRKQREDQIQKGGKFQALEKAYKDSSQEVARINTLVELKMASIKEDDEKCAVIEANIVELEKKHAQQIDNFNRVETDYEKAKASHTKIVEEIAKKEELLQSLQTGVSSREGQETGYASQVQEVRTTVNDTKVKAAQAEVRIGHLEKLIAEDEPKTANARKQNQKVVSDLVAMENRYHTLKAQLEKAGWEPGKLEQLKAREYELAEKVRELSQQIETMRRKVSNIEFNYTRPSPLFRASSVKGLVAQLFSINKENQVQATALEVCAAGRLFNVVVDTDVTGAELLQKGELKRRVTIIPLNKIAGSRLSEDRLNAAKQLAPGKVELALNVIGYEAEVYAAMEYVFGTTLLCADTESSKLVTFDPKVRAKSVTLEGDIYDPMGTLSGGSKSSTDGVLIVMQKYNELNRTLKRAQNELDDIRVQIKRENELMTRFKDSKKEMDLKEHEIKLCKEQLETSPHASILIKHDERTNEIISLNQQIAESRRVFEEGSVELARIEKDIAEFKSDKGSKLDKLRQEVEHLKLVDQEESTALTGRLEAYQMVQVEMEQLSSDLATFKEQLDDNNNNIEDLKTSLSELSKELTSSRAKEAKSLQQLEAEKTALVGMDDELSSMESTLSVKKKFVTESGLESQKLGHQVEKLKKDVDGFQNALKILSKEYEWISDQKQHFGVRGSPYDFHNINVAEYRRELKRLGERTKGMKKNVNSKVMNMIESVEKKEVALKGMIQTIEKDKKKIEDTIVSLDEYKRKALLKTWEKVSVYVWAKFLFIIIWANHQSIMTNCSDFGKIFSELLPGSLAKLVPQENKDVTEGLEVKVSLGNVWKDGLAELSGGQRSLIALSLILALLQFKPAPMYILDEVDAALDLHHTQNIGQVIKTRFQGSQFIIVSLKEGMFSNANRVFRTRFQEGTSTVSVM
jgi:structural maintenance of chromosome 2